MLATASTMYIRLGEFTVTLLPSKAVWQPELHTVFIADTHFGKAATMRRAGLPVPAGTTAQTLQRLSSLIAETNAKRLVVLGDLIHSSVSAQDDFESELTSWRRDHGQLEFLLVKGNHDRREAAFYKRLDIETVPEPHGATGLQLCHDVNVIVDKNTPRLGGHFHPGIMLRTLSKLPLPCFYRQGNALTLPSFGSFTGCARVQPQTNETCYAVAENVLIQIDSYVEMQH